MIVDQLDKDLFTILTVMLTEIQMIRSTDTKNSRQSIYKPVKKAISKIKKLALVAYIDYKFFN